MILTLKRYKFITYKQFKMESIDNVINLLKPNVYMALLDFFSVPVHPEHQNYLFFWLYKFTCMSNGYVPVMDMGSESFY